MVNLDGSSVILIEIIDVQKLVMENSKFCFNLYINMTKVGVIYNKNLSYPKFPFNPNKSYPEINYKYTLQSENLIYEEMRNLFNKMGYDKENFNTKNWNPLGFLIKKGDKVLIKPNFVIDYNEHPFAVITHPSIIRFLIDYIDIATGKSGKIIVADAPQMNANKQKILEYTNIENLIEYLNEKKVNVKFIDLRAISYDTNWKKKSFLNGDPMGSKIIDLKKNSQLLDLEKQDKDIFYGADNNRKIVNYNHNLNRNSYRISRTLLDSDVVISVPKLKTHKKVGVTLNLKNFVGINVHKNYLPHYRIGCPEHNGDAYPNMNSFLNSLRFLRYLFRDCFLSRKASKIGRLFHKLMDIRKYFEYVVLKILFPQFYSQYFHFLDGNWSGNDTTWRTALDLNIIIQYANKEGVLQNKRQRKFFSVIDGIIGGEREGPLRPSLKNSGVLVMGQELLLNDLVATKIMGFDYKKIPLLKKALSLKKFPLIEKKYEENEIEIISNEKDLHNNTYGNFKLNLNYSPSRGWNVIRLK